MKSNNLRYFKDNLLYYFSVMMPVTAYLLCVYYFLSFRDMKLDTYTDTLFIVLKLSWLAGVLVIPISFISWIFIGSPLRRDEENLEEYKKKGWNKEYQLVVAYVSRGSNMDALNRSVCSAYKLLKTMRVNFTLEVITDVYIKDKLRCRSGNLLLHQVPDAYVTTQGAKYKARALHYAVGKRIEHSGAEDLKNTWIFHVDEESILTPEVIAGISKFINDPNNSDAIGQGEIKYNAYGYFDNILIGAIDSIRTGDDLGRFRFQFKILETPISGMHGSFMLIPASVENKIGFDLGSHGSITEDAYFALLASEKGYKFKWVEGYIREQSPFTLKDLIKQRRRWLCGLNVLAFDRDVSFKRRAYLMMSLILWKISWLSVFVTIANLLMKGSYFPLSLILVSAIMASGYFSSYMVGVYRNLLDTKFSQMKKMFIYMATLVLVPFSACVEGVAVVYAIIKPIKSFEIIRK